MSSSSNLKECDSLTKVSGPGNNASDTSNATDAPEKSPFSILSSLSTIHKATLLVIFCLAAFLDTFNNCALYSAVPIISEEVSLANSQSVWLINAYQIAFAALLLVSGRASDIYNAKWMLVIGSGMLTVFSLVDGFIHSAIPLLVLRGLMGAGAALTTPSAQHLIVHMYPDPGEQAKAIGVFGAFGAVGNVTGLIIGALFVQYVSWHWIFWFTAIMMGIVTVGSMFLIPNARRAVEQSQWMRFRRLDPIGLSQYAIASILFIFAVTSGSVVGWGSAQVIAPLVLSIVLAACFGVWEAWIPDSYAALPPRAWRYPNFGILLVVSLLLFPLVSSGFLLFSWFWELVYDWSAIKTAVHLLPLGLTLFLIMPISALLLARLRVKWVVLIGLLLMLISSILLPFASSPAEFWRFAFPGFVIGSAGMSLMYVTVNIALLAVTPAEMSGVVSAVFNCALESSSALGTGIVTSIQTSVQEKHGGPDGFQGRAAGFWFLAALIGTVTLLFLVFMKDTLGPIDSSGPPVHADSGATEPAPKPAGADSCSDVEKAAGGSDAEVAVVE